MNGSDVINIPNVSKKCPKIGVVKTRESRKDISLTGDPFHIAAYQTRTGYVACDYDMPQGNLTQVTRGMTRGPVTVFGKTCVEMVETQYDLMKGPQLMTRRFVHVGNRYAMTLLINLRRAGGIGFVEHVRLDIPLQVNSNSAWTVWEMDPDSGETSPHSAKQRVSGVYNVFIAKKQHTCIRWIRTRISNPGKMAEAEEVFVDIESGLTVLIRHYVGQGWPNLDDFKKSPKMEIEGKIYYLWYVRRITRD